MAEVSFKVDKGTLAAFQKQLATYAAQAAKGAEYALNRTAKDISIRAYQETRKADVLKMIQQLTTKYQFDLFGKSGKRLKRGRKVVEGSEMVFRIINARRKKEGLPLLAGAAMAKEAAKFINRRVASAGYIAAGFIPAIKTLGGSVSGVRLQPGGEASKGYAIKATVKKLKVEVLNSSTGAEEIASPAVEAAIRSKTADLEKYLREKMSGA